MAVAWAGCTEARQGRSATSNCFVATRVRGDVVCVGLGRMPSTNNVGMQGTADGGALLHGTHFSYAQEAFG
jgi:hypothetical protein